jgi:prepilin-type N-terminal cleavage/methylation domain-containing protein
MTGRGSAAAPRRATRPVDAPLARIRGFTLVEILVAMSILVVITLIVSGIFQQTTVTWDSGSRRAEMNMTGRALADLMAQEISQAVQFVGPINDHDITFWVVAECAGASARARRQVQFLWGGGVPRRNGVEMATGIQDVSFVPEPGATDPRYVDVRVTLLSEDDQAKGQSSHPGVYEARAYLQNRKRYAYD